jgi:hypothetical protein
VDALAAALRADSADLEAYARVLTTSLADALPTGMVAVDRDRSMGDRLAGRPGQVRSLRVSAGEVSLELAGGRGGVPVARVARAVRGVVISSREVAVEEWVRALADLLAARARESAAARASLSRLLGAG